MIKYCNLFLTIWVVYTTLFYDQFVDKLNSLPKKTVEEAKITPRSYGNCFYIIYWQD